MALVRHRPLCAWDRLQAEGIEIDTPEKARTRGLKEVHIGFLNMMPDRALKATERQFLRLIGGAAQHSSVYVYPFTINGLPRARDVLDYVADVYDAFEAVRQYKLDGLVLTGANPGNAEITAEGFWPYFVEVAHWANEHVPTMFCSCLASHAILKIFYGIERTRCSPDKRWGVYSHQVIADHHPLMAGMPRRFEEPRSHVFEMTARQLEPHGIQILAASPDADFHSAVTSDDLKWVFLQGHPEYDEVSLLKEYKREVNLFVRGERTEYPEIPVNYLAETARLRLERFRSQLLDAMARKGDLPELPETEILPSLRNIWHEHGKILFKNWLRLAGSRGASETPDLQRDEDA